MKRIGSRVRIQIPGLHGMKTVTGTIARFPDEWTVEVRTQQDGYYIVANTQATPVVGEKGTP